MCPHFCFCDVMSLNGIKSDLKFEILEILCKFLMVFDIFCKFWFFYEVWPGNFFETGSETSYPSHPTPSPALSPTQIVCFSLAMCNLYLISSNHLTHTPPPLNYCKKNTVLYFNPIAESSLAFFWRLQYSDALFGRITVFKSFIKDFPSL